MRAATSSARAGENAASARACRAHIGRRSKTGFRDAAARVSRSDIVDQLAHQGTDQFADEAAEFQLAIARPHRP